MLSFKYGTGNPNFAVLWPYTSPTCPLAPVVAKQLVKGVQGIIGPSGSQRYIQQFTEVNNRSIILINDTSYYIVIVLVLHFPVRLTRHLSVL